MARAALLTAGLLAIAACSSSGDAEPSPPLETEAPTSTTETPPTTEAAETTTSTTPATEPTTASTATEPAATSETGAVDRVAVFEEAFAQYEAAWATRRAAIRSPLDSELRDALNDAYIDNDRLARVNEFLDARADADDQVIEDPTSPSSLDFIEGVLVTSDGGISQFLVCETLRDDVIDPDGTITFSENISYRNQVTMELVDGAWKVQLESTDEEFADSEGCS